MRIVLPEEEAYFAAVIARHETSTPVPGHPFPDGRPAECHRNAEEFAHAEPGCEVVRGWLLMPIGGAEGYYRLVCHSVVRRAGMLVDVTPLSEAERAMHRFVEHEGSEEEFQLLRAKYADLVFPIITIPAEQMHAPDFGSFFD